MQTQRRQHVLDAPHRCRENHRSGALIVRMWRSISSSTQCQRDASHLAQHVGYLPNEIRSPPPTPRRLTRVRRGCRELPRIICVHHPVERPHAREVIALAAILARQLRHPERTVRIDLPPDNIAARGGQTCPRTPSPTDSAPSYARCRQAAPIGAGQHDTFAARAVLNRDVGSSRSASPCEEA